MTNNKTPQKYDLNAQISHHIKTMRELAAVEMNAKRAQSYVHCITFMLQHHIPQNMLPIRHILLERFNDILPYSTLWQAADIANGAFQCAYTLFSKNNHLAHIDIPCYILTPFYHYAKQKLQKIKPLIGDLNIQKGERYVFVTQAGQTSGHYSPGIMHYAMIKALLEHQKKVTLIVPKIAIIDEHFQALQKTYQPHFACVRTANFGHNSDPQTILKIFKDFLDLLNKEQPRVIFSDFITARPALLSILGTTIPMIFLSAGYYNLPFYDKIAH
ncbi:MAG: hypothetical protein AAF403_08495, partial [Pseudomonadota bacterium]